MDMRNILIIVILFLITSSSGIAQGRITVSPDQTILSRKVLSVSKDTIILNEPLQIHYIKIGSFIYEINSPAPIIEQKKQPLYPYSEGIMIAPTDSIFLIPNDQIDPIQNIPLIQKLSL
jgi:hypothetical protein